MKIVLAQQNYHIGNFQKNSEKIIAGIEQAKQMGADLVVFSEQCVWLSAIGFFLSSMILPTTVTRPLTTTTIC